MPKDRGTRGETDPKRHANPHALQRRRPGGGGLRDRDGADACGSGERATLLRLCGRDPTPPARSPPHGVGALGSRDRARNHHGRRRGPLPRARGNRPRPRRRGSDCGQRRHGEQNRHLRESGRREGKRRPVLRRGADEHDRRRSGVGCEDPHRGAISTRGAPSRRASHCPEGKSGPQSRLRRHAGQVHHGNHHRAGDPEAVSTPVFREGRAEEESAPQVSVGGYAFTDRARSPRAMLLLTTWFGSFLLDEGTVVDKRLFPMDPNGLADRLAQIEDWKVLDEERDLMARADEVFVIEPRLERAGGNRTTVRPPFLKPEDFGYGRELLHGAMVQLAKRRMRKAAGAALAKLVADQRRAVEAYVERSIRELAPNVSELAGPIIAARLVTLAGGVDDLARAPAGTVQLLGAERALFRHLRTGSRPPKHGVLFQHPWVHGAPPWQRGAIARAFAAKISVAARADAYTKRKIAPDLLKKLEIGIEEIRRRKADKPTRPTRPAAPKNRAHGRRTRR